MEKLWEYHYGLLSEAEAAALRVRLEQEPALAAAFEQVQQEASQIAQAARIAPSRPLSFSVPEEEKKSVCAPPDLPDEVAEITGNFSAVLESLPSANTSSERLKPPILLDTFIAAQKEATPRTAWNPFASRFSPQYARLNRILTICTIFLLILTLTGFNLIRQTQTLLSNNLLQIQVVMPEVLARQTHNTLSINVSDIRGLPKQVPVRVSLLSDSGEKIALYQEKTDSQGSLHLALESPADLPANAFLEISAGEEKAMRTVRRMIPVVESGEEKRSFARSLPVLPTESHHLSGFGHSYAPYYQNTQNAVKFPSDATQNRLRMDMNSGMGGMNGGMGMRESGGMSGPAMVARTASVPARPAPSPGSLQSEREFQAESPQSPDTRQVAQRRAMELLQDTTLQEPLEVFADDLEMTDASSAEPERAIEPTLELILEKREFDQAQPIQFQLRSVHPEQPLIASVSRQGIPLAQFPVKTPPLPGTLATIEVPENESLTGLLQVALFDPATNPAKELASESVFRRSDRYLKIKKIEESQGLPTAIKITDEKGAPVAADVRFSWWEGDAPQTAVIPSPVLVDNQRQIQAEWEMALSKRKPVFAEMLGFFTVLAILGGMIVSGVILVLFFLRRLSGYTPLVFAGITGTTCLLLGASLMHDRQAPVSIPIREKSVLSAPVDTEEAPQSMTPERFEQWTARSDAQGICPVDLADQLETPSTIQIEVFTSDRREGFMVWDIY